MTTRVNWVPELDSARAVAEPSFLELGSFCQNRFPCSLYVLYISLGGLAPLSLKDREPAQP
jgi:hypothetical protein